MPHCVKRKSGGDFKEEKRMTNNRFYAAVTVQDDGKYYSYVIPFSSSDNALCKLTVKGILSANIYKSKKEAAEIVKCWNDAYKANGTYMFSDTF